MNATAAPGSVAPMEEKGGLPVLAFDDDAAWEAWLAEHHASAAGVWVKIAKKASGVVTVTKVEAIRTALCWGWIDGQIGRWDEQYSVSRFTPRRARSNWSQINVRHVEELTAQGRMQPAGLAHVEAAKADGRWEAAYASSATMVVPPELQAELDRSPAAAAAWEQLSQANRFAMYHRIANAKRQETKLRNAEKFARMLERGEKLH